MQLKKCTDALKRTFGHNDTAKLKVGVSALPLRATVPLVCNEQKVDIRNRSITKNESAWKKSFSGCN